MELALIPVAAILLLLSGASAPAQAQTGRLSAIALMRGLLGATTPVAAARARHHGSRAGGGQTFLAPTPPAMSRELAASIAGSDLGPAAPPGLARTTERKRFRTRFGFAEGAYLAIGPPPVGPLVDLG